MSDHQTNDPGEEDIEALLRDIRLAKPSRAMDRRMTQMFRPSWRAFIGPLSGFAAGILVTVAVFQYRAGASNPTHPVSPINLPSLQATPAPAPLAAIAIENRNVDAIGDGSLDGLPVRMEQRQSRMVLVGQNATGGLWRAELNSPPQTVLRNVHLY